MKKYYFLLFLLFLMACGRQEPQSQTPTLVDKGNTKQELVQEGPRAKETLSFDSLKLEGSDLETGQPLDSSIFKEAKVTMVNVWASFCQPCIEEMPDLARLDQEGQGQFQVLGIALDTLDKSMDNRQEARKILEASGVDFKNLSPSQDFIENYSANFQLVPTSFVVDQEGHLIGRLKLGAGSYEEYKSLIEEALKEIE